MKLNLLTLTLGSALLLGALNLPAAGKPDATSAAKGRAALAVLQSTAPDGDKAIACKELAVFGTPDAVPALAALLCDEHLASWARIALEAMPGRAADAALRDALPRLQGRLLVGVINSIGVRRDTRAVSALARLLASSDDAVARAAALALGRIGGDSAARAVAKSLTGGSAATRSAAAQGLVLAAEQRLASGKTSSAARWYDAVRAADVPAQRRLEGTRGAILARQAKGLPLLLESLRSSDKGVWNIGLRTARELKGVKITEALTAELRQTRPERAGALFLAIADRSDAAVLPVVLATAQGGAKNLQLLAIEAMIRDGKPACIPVLLDLLANHDVEVAKSAKSALGSWWSKEVDAQLTTRLAAASGSSRRWLLELAGQRHTTAALPELVRAARDGDATIRTAAVKALGDTVGVADLGVLTDLLAAARTDDERSVVQDALESACTRLEDKAGCAGKLIATLSAASSPVKCSLLRVLAAVPTPAALTAVQSALASSETSVRDAAVRVLADWPEAPALPAVLEVFRTTSDESHRFLALRGCVRLLDLGTEPAARAVETYRDLLGRTQRPDDRKVILSGLANVADVAALKLVEPLLAETEVRAEAEMAALKIATSIKKSAPAEAQAMATRLQSESKSETTRDGAAKLLKDLDKNR